MSDLGHATTYPHPDSTAARIARADQRNPASQMRIMRSTLLRAWDRPECDKRLQRSHLAVLNVLERAQMLRYGDQRLTVAVIAQQAGYCDRTVRAACKDLEEWGYLDIKENISRWGQGANTYHVRRPKNIDHKAIAKRRAERKRRDKKRKAGRARNRPRQNQRPTTPAPTPTASRAPRNGELTSTAKLLAELVETAQGGSAINNPPLTRTPAEPSFREGEVDAGGHPSPPPAPSNGAHTPLSRYLDPQTSPTRRTRANGSQEPPQVIPIATAPSPPQQSAKDHHAEPRTTTAPDGRLGASPIERASHPPDHRTPLPQVSTRDLPHTPAANAPNGPPDLETSPTYFQDLCAALAKRAAVRDDEYAT